MLIRGFCTAGRDGIVICPPTFDMYRLYAGIQNADVTRVPLLRERNFALDADEILASLDAHTKIVFICSPNNPTGQSMARADVERICRETAGRALVVLDEAYHEFAEVRRLPRPAQPLRARRAAAHAVEIRVARGRPLRPSGRRAGDRRVLAVRAAAVHFPDAVDRARARSAVDGRVARLRGARRAAEARARAVVGRAARRSCMCGRYIRATRTS